MIATSTILYFAEAQQDTLAKPQQPLPGITVRRPQLDLKRAEEVIRQFEQREQEIEASQRRTVRPKPVETLRAPSIEVDTVMARYGYIGCSPRACFPDTFTLTALERYYQPMSSATTDYPTDAPMISATVAKPPVNQGFATIARHDGYPPSVTLFLTGALMLLAVIRHHFGRNLTDAFQSFFSCRQAMRLFEERRESDRQAALLSNILFALITGIFISTALPFFGVNRLWESYTLSILFFALATGLLYILKCWAWQAMGVVFRIQPFSRIYIYNMFLYNRNIGLMIFPPVAAIPYIAAAAMPYVLYSVIGIFVLSYLLKLWRIFQIIHAKNVSVFYFILYLCTLEILPLLLLMKGCKVLIESVFM